MRRLALLLPALLAGCLATPSPRVNNRARGLLPPLPPSPGGEPIIIPASAPRPVRALWTLTPGTLDTLETSHDMFHWSDLPGPYGTLDTGGMLSYNVSVTQYATTNAFFRIRRVWGNPWVITPKTESKTETEK